MELLMKAGPFYFAWPQPVADVCDVFSTATEIISFRLFSELNNQNDTGKKDNIQGWGFFPFLFSYCILVSSSFQFCQYCHSMTILKIINCFKVLFDFHLSNANNVTDNCFEYSFLYKFTNNQIHSHLETQLSSVTLAYQTVNLHNEKMEKNLGSERSPFYLNATRNILLVYLADFSCVCSQYRSNKCLLCYPHLFKTPGKQF